MMSTKKRTGKVVEVDMNDYMRLARSFRRMHNTTKLLMKLAGIPDEELKHRRRKRTPKVKQTTVVTPEQALSQ